MKSTLRLALVLSAVCFVALPSRADVAPPENEPCLGRALGAVCTFKGASGSCQNQTCVSPSAGSYVCVQCTTGTNTNTSTSTKTATNTDGGDSPTKDSGSCSIGNQSAAKRVAPWLFAAAFSSLFLIGRRRRR